MIESGDVIFYDLGKLETALAECDRLRSALASIEAIAVCVGVVDPTQHQNMLASIATLARKSRTPAVAQASREDAT